MAFATYQDVEARWRTLTAEEQARAEVLLEDASNMLIGMVTIDVSDQQQAKNLKQVCANMVIRSMVASASETYGVDELHLLTGTQNFPAQAAYKKAGFVIHHETYMAKEVPPTR